MPLSKKLGRLSSSGQAEILAFVSHCSANFQPILDCFILNFKLKYEDPENIIADRVTTVVFSLYQMKCRAFFWNTEVVRLSYQILYGLKTYNRSEAASFHIRAF